MVSNIFSAQLMICYLKAKTQFGAWQSRGALLCPSYERKPFLLLTADAYFVLLEIEWSIQDVL